VAARATRLFDAPSARRAVSLHQNVEDVVGPETKLVSRHPNDARVAGAKHLDLSAATQAEFLQSMHVIDRPDDPAHFGGLTRSQTAKRNDVIHELAPSGINRGILSKLRVILSIASSIVCRDNPFKPVGQRILRFSANRLQVVDL
jgi:hypothetical protein